jgi:hypothetical protein
MVVVLVHFADVHGYITILPQYIKNQISSILHEFALF